MLSLSRIVAPSLRLALGLVVGAAAHAQTVSVDTVPAYGTLGSITGTVTGVDPATHHVAVYIQIEGSGWWTKPTAVTRTVSIGGGGGFSAFVGTGGPGSLDPQATIFCAALLPIAETPPLAAGAGRIPASLAPLALDCVERYGRTIEFAGLTWAVKGAPLPAGPGSNLFSDRESDVWVDEDGLHLRVAEFDGDWWAVELILLSPVGYGTYAIQTRSRLDVLDPRLTFGMFVWDTYGDDDATPGSDHREVDFEDSRWSDALEPTSSQWVVQPFAAPGHLQRYTLPDLSADAALTRVISWEPERVKFTALLGHHGPDATTWPAASVIEQDVFAHDPPFQHVPPSGRERFRLNLWLNPLEVGAGVPMEPTSGQPVEVVIEDFVFVPEPGRALSAAAGGLVLVALARRRGAPGASPR